MVLINNLTIDEINAALLHLQRARTEVVGGTKGSTVQNITISNKGGGSTVDYAPTITALSNRIDKNTDDIESVEDEIDKIQETLEQLSDNGISSMTFDPVTRQLQINTQDGEVYSCDITSENITLNFDATTNKLTLEMGEQYQEVTLPYINANEKGSANGVATLDSSGRVPYSQLPESAMEFLGNWNASTNTPHLQDGTGTNGDFYVCNVGGTVTFGTGNTQTFVPNDRVIYNGTSSQWVKLPAGQVSSVNGMSGDVTLTATDIEYSTGVSIKAKIDANAVQADWNVTDTTSLAYIKNKPTIPASPVQSDWNVTDTTSLAYIKNKPSVAVLGNTAGCGLGTASAGSCTTAARSDHVHPIPYCVHTSSDSANWFVYTRYNICSDNHYFMDVSNTCDGTSRWNIRVDCATCASKVFLDSFYSSADRPVMVACPRGTTGYSTQGVSTVCPLTYNPATGDLKKNGGSLNGYTASVGMPNNTMRYVLVDLGSKFGGNAVAQIYSSKYFINKSDSSSVVVTDGMNYGSFAFAHLGTEASPSSCIWLRFSGWRPMFLCGSYPMTIVCNTTTAPSGITFVSPIYMVGRALTPLGNCVSCTTTANDNVGLYYGSYGSNSSMPGTNGNIIQMQSGTGSSSRWGYQLAFPTGESPRYRRWTNTTSMGGWNCFITSENIGSQHVACADCASCAGTVMGECVCGWDWIGACARIYRVLNGVYLFQIYGNTCEANVFEAFCRFVCSRNLVLFSTCYHSLCAMGTATQLNTCHCSIGSVCWDESSGDMYRWTFHGAAGYKTFNKNCACSINLNMISFIMGL